MNHHRRGRSELKVVLSLQQLPMEINYWQMQNIYFQIARTTYEGISRRALSGEKEAADWINAFKELGEALWFNVAAILPRGNSHG